MPLVRKSPREQTPPVAQEWPEIARQLQSPDARVRWAAARQSGGFAQAVPELGRNLTAEPDAHVREAIFTSLARIGTAESFDAILVHLRADDAALRTAALDALKLMPGFAGPRLDTLLGDADADIRVLACDLARSVPAASARQSLRAVLRHEPEVNVCAAAVDLLAEIGTPEILPDLAGCAARLADRFLGFSVQAASRQITARSALPRA